MIFDLTKTIIEAAWTVFGDRRKVRVQVHRAIFDSGLECFFVNVTNLSKTREVEITHVWFGCSPPVYVEQATRPLPKRLKNDESWETWLPVDRMPPRLRATAQVYSLARVRLSSGKVIKSRENIKVIGAGVVPGGDILD